MVNLTPTGGKTHVCVLLGSRWYLETTARFWGQEKPSKRAWSAELEMTRKEGKKKAGRNSHMELQSEFLSAFVKSKPKHRLYKCIIRMSQNTQCGTTHKGAPEMNCDSVHLWYPGVPNPPYACPAVLRLCPRKGASLSASSGAPASSDDADKQDLHPNPVYLWGCATCNSSFAPGRILVFRLEFRSKQQNKTSLSTDKQYCPYTLILLAVRINYWFVSTHTDA